MKIKIHCKDMPLTDAIRMHVEGKLQKLEKVLPDGIEPLVMLHAESESQGGAFSAEVNFRVWGHDVVSKSTSDDLYKSVNEVTEKLHEQVRRLKNKQKSRRKGGASLRNYQEPPLASQELTDEFDQVDVSSDAIEHYSSDAIEHYSSDGMNS